MARVLSTQQKALSMPRKATGQVIAPAGKQRSWALRFRACGKRRYVTLGRPEEGWNRERAETELRHVLADVERGGLAAGGGHPATSQADCFSHLS